MRKDNRALWKNQAANRRFVFIPGDFLRDSSLKYKLLTDTRGSCKFRGSDRVYFSGCISGFSLTVVEQRFNQCSFFLTLVDGSSTNAGSNLSSFPIPRLSPNDIKYRSLFFKSRSILSR